MSRAQSAPLLALLAPLRTLEGPATRPDAAALQAARKPANPPAPPRRPCPLMAERVQAYRDRGAVVTRGRDGWVALTLSSGRCLELSPASAELYSL